VGKTGGEERGQTHTEWCICTHTNDKHAQGDKIKILGRRLGRWGWGLAIGGLRLVVVRRDSSGRLRGQVGRHGGRRECVLESKQDASWTGLERDREGPCAQWVQARVSAHARGLGRGE
jgi:hypothetical protein